MVLPAVVGLPVIIIYRLRESRSSISVGLGPLSEVYLKKEGLRMSGVARGSNSGSFFTDFS